MSLHSTIRILCWCALLSVLCVALDGCQSTPPAPLAQEVRFLLTFDDGPSAHTDDNSTLSVLEQLSENDVQKGIKGIFFVQTRNRNGGGTEIGKDVMRLTHSEGHMLGLHSADPSGHVGHTRMSLYRLNQSLVDGKSDIRHITGSNPEFVRPPGWVYNQETQELYRNQGLRMLLADVKARDGVIHVFNFSLRRRSHIRSELEEVRAAISEHQLPQVHGVVPVIVGFHDVNTFTASHFPEYLHILIEEAAKAGLKLAKKPFFDNTGELVNAARYRSTPVPAVARHDGPEAHLY
jgi:peptidoglycan/xylan/chitin deacetylase (PgdA/CDA1 family)